MRAKLTKIRPKKGMAHVFHLVLTFFLPLLVYIMVATHVVWAALLVILLSKWRMLAVKPRHWPANIRANGIDLLVGLSFLVFMSQSGSQLFQLGWALLYGVWLLVLKPGSKLLSVSIQAIVGQVLALTALYLRFGGMNTTVLVLATWGICYLSVRHFLASFDEPYTRLFSYLWAYFGGALAWLLCHWLLFYGPIAQPALLINVIGFGIGTLYYLQETDRLSKYYRQQIFFIVLAVIAVLIVFSNWGDRAV